MSVTFNGIIEILAFVTRNVFILLYRCLQTESSTLTFRAFLTVIPRLIQSLQNVSYDNHDAHFLAG